MHNRNAPEDEENAQAIYIYPWQPLGIRRNLTPQTPRARLPFKLKVLKPPAKCRPARQQPRPARRKAIPHTHHKVRRCISAVGMNGLYMMSDHSAMGMAAARKILREFAGLGLSRK